MFWFLSRNSWGEGMGMGGQGAGIKRSCLISLTFRQLLGALPTQLGSSFPYAFTSMSSWSFYFSVWKCRSVIECKSRRAGICRSDKQYQEKKKKRNFTTASSRKRPHREFGFLNGISSPDPSAPAGTPSSLWPRITGGSEEEKRGEGEGGGSDQLI